MPRKPQAKSRAPKNKPVGPNGKAPRVYYSPATVDRICRRIARGEPWLELANKPGIPSYDRLYAWRNKYPEFAEALARARLMAAEVRADQAVQAAEAITVDTLAVGRVKIAAYQKFAKDPAPPGHGSKRNCAPPPPKPIDPDKPRRFIVEVRRWTKVTLPDGKVVLREVFPEGHKEEGA